MQRVSALLDVLTALALTGIERVMGKSKRSEWLEENEMKCASQRRKKRKQWKVRTVAFANDQQVSVFVCALARLSIYRQFVNIDNR